MEKKEIELTRQYSKTFTFDDPFKAADLINTLNLRVVYVSHENKLRITVQGSQLQIVENLLHLFSAQDDEGDPGKWRDTAK